MESAQELLIVIDPGHGGFDNGASYQDRSEKNDNLRLGLEVQKQLQQQGVNVLMTRDSDIFVPLQERANIANGADADLIVSLHRNSAPPMSPRTNQAQPTQANGIEAFIYLTAPDETSGQAARLILEAVAQVGVQNNRGVKRGNYYVLRKTKMPAVLLEMGFINNPTDNEYFDANMNAYAAAVAKGILAYFGIPYVDQNVKPSPPIGRPPITPPIYECPGVEVIPPFCNYPRPEQPKPPEISPPLVDVPSRHPTVREAQIMLNESFNVEAPLSGAFDAATRTTFTAALQSVLNGLYNARLEVDGIYGPKTRAAMPVVSLGARGYLVLLTQILLALHGYNPGKPDSIFGVYTRSAVQQYQRDNNLPVTGTLDITTLNQMLA